MATVKQDPPRQSAGWVVAAIVAVVAVCAVSFMITQRPQQAMAVAEGDPLTGEMLRGPQSPPTTPGGAPETIRVHPLAANQAPKRDAALPALSLGPLDATAVGSNASAVESAR